MATHLLLGPANYDFQGTRGITRLDDFDNSDKTSENDENIQDKKDDVNIVVPGAHEAESQTGKGEIDMKTLQASFKRAACYSLTLTLIVAIVGEYVPVFSKR